MMKRWLRWMMVVGVCAVAGAESVYAQDAQQEPSLTQDEQQMNEDAASAAGQQQVKQRLMTEFGVEEARIDGLRDENLGYGEIHHALSIAQQTPGGITDESISAILQMRQEQHMGWGNISKEMLGQKLGPTIKPGAEATPPAESSQAAVQPQSLTRPGHSAGSRGAKPGRGSSVTFNSRGQLERSGQAIGQGGGMGHGGGGGVGGQRGSSFQAPGHNR